MCSWFVSFFVGIQSRRTSVGGPRQGLVGGYPFSDPMAPWTRGDRDGSAWKSRDKAGRGYSTRAVSLRSLVISTRGPAGTRGHRSRVKVAPT